MLMAKALSRDYLKMNLRISPDMSCERVNSFLKQKT